MVNNSHDIPSFYCKPQFKIFELTNTYKYKGPWKHKAMRYLTPKTFLKNAQKYIICLFLAMLGLHCYADFSPVVVSRGCSLAAVHRLSLWWLFLLGSMGSRGYGPK